MIAVALTIPDVVVYVVAALMIVVGALGVISFRNPVHCALSLIMTLFGVAIAFIEQEAQFLAAVEIIVYAGAIVILFLFVIMFLGVDRRDEVRVDPLVGQRAFAGVGVVITIAGIIFLMARSHWITGVPHVSTGVATKGNNSNVQELGRAVFTTYLFAFEATAALLVIAVVGAVVLARRERASTLESSDA
jgi:NADH-quinone oxidoreductase subunit J